MDASVPGAALAADRDRRRPPGEIEVELLFERVAKFLAHEVVKEFAERRTIGKLGDRKAPAIRDLWIIRINLRPRLGADKAGYDEIFERLPRQRDRFQGFEVEGA